MDTGFVSDLIESKFYRNLAQGALMEIDRRVILVDKAAKGDGHVV